MAKNYVFTVSGTAADEQTWTVSGSMRGLVGDFSVIAQTVLRRAFNALTQGQAVFGKPGVGCRGPYDITELTIRSVE